MHKSNSKMVQRGINLSANTFFNCLKFAQMYKQISGQVAYVLQIKTGEKLHADNSSYSRFSEEIPKLFSYTLSLKSRLRNIIQKIRLKMFLKNKITDTFATILKIHVQNENNSFYKIP